MVNNDALVRELYEGFNRRDIPAVLTLLAENVNWANGMDGGRVTGARPSELTGRSSGLR